jgi:Flp pilus assembly protein TadG
MTSIRKALFGRWLRLRRSARALVRDASGIAAVEFALLVPVMLVAFFGTVEICSAVAVDRKVTLIARTVSDLTSQAAITVDQTYLQNVFTASISIITPYASTPVLATVSQVYVDSSGNAKVQWSQSAFIANAAATQATLTASSYTYLQDVTAKIPTALLIPKTYLIWSQVSYKYMPTIGYVMAKTGINLSDMSFTRPRQNTCITFNNVPASTCPLT